MFLSCVSTFPGLSTLKFLKPILLLLVLSVYLFLIYQNRFIQDDAYINFRFVENFIGGSGLVFNAGEQVEGFTSFSWILILSAAKLLGADLIIFSQIASITFGALIIFILYLLSAHGKNQCFVFTASSLLLTSSNGFIYWAASGMETTFFAFLILLWFYFYLKNENLKSNYAFYFIAFLSIITRQEALAILIIFSLHNFFTKRSLYSSNHDYKKVVVNFGILLIVILILLFTRIYYYGYIFPNTYYAKTNFILPYFYRGIDYVINWLHYDLIFGILLIPLVYYFIKSKNQILIIPLFLLGFYLFYNFYIGGDVLPHNRFFIPILGLIYYSIAYSLFNLVDYKWISYLALAFFLSTVFIKFNLNSEKVLYTKNHELGLVKKMQIYADYLNQSNYRNKTASISTIGSFGYYFEGKVIDMVGLTDEFIAHNPKEIIDIDENVPVGWKERTYNIDYIFDRRPDVIIFPAGYKPTAFPEAALFSDIRFYKNYHVQLLFDNELNQLLPFFTRRPVPFGNTMDCDNHERKWVSNFILCNNLLLEFISTKNESLISKIESEANNILVNKCRENEAFLILGMLKFHQKKLAEASTYFERILNNDDQNSIAYYYLMLINSALNDQTKLLNYINNLKRVSPGALPNYLK